MGGGILKIGFINSELVPYAALHLEKEMQFSRILRLD